MDGTSSNGWDQGVGGVNGQMNPYSSMDESVKLKKKVVSAKHKYRQLKELFKTVTVQSPALSASCPPF